MRIKQQANRITACIVFFAILFSTMAPFASQALSTANSSDQWVKICSAAGDKLVQLNPDGELGVPLPDPGMAHGQHCLFCLNHATALYLPVVYQLLLLLLPDNARVWPALHYLTPQPLDLWPASPARAPPAPF